MRRLTLLLVLLAVDARAEAGAPQDYRQARSAGFIRLMQQIRDGDFGRSRPPGPEPDRRGGAAGGNTRVNDPALDTPERTTQSETTLAVVGDTVCAGYVDTGPGGTSGISRSSDRGNTWGDRGSVIFGTDPVLAAHAATGRFYLAKLAFAPGLGTTIGVFSSDDDCQSFPNFGTASPTGSLPIHSQDKPWIAVDNTGGARDGAVYTCWTRFVDDNPGPSTGAEIRFSRSLDGGGAFVDDQAISPPTDDFPFGCFVAVGTAGEVYVSWAVRSAEGVVRFRRSLDGGQTWDPPVQVSTRPIRHPGIDRIRGCEAGSNRPTLNGDIRMLAQTWMATDTSAGPHRGNIYLVWADDPVGEIDNSDVYFSRSIDGGSSWTPEVQLGGGTATDQFEPFVAVGGSGALAAAWYDRRNDPGENFLIDVYTAVSRDGGDSFGPLTRITDVSFPVPPLRGQATGNFDPGRNACYMGEYIAIASGDDFFHYAWGDNRNTLVTPSYPDGRPDPDVYAARLAVPGICGDRTLDADERCDDGNLLLADGCGPDCIPEGDANCDGRVSAADLPALLSLVGLGQRAVCDGDDANADGVLDAGDLDVVLRGITQERAPL